MFHRNVESPDDKAKKYDEGDMKYEKKNSKLDGFAAGMFTTAIVGVCGVLVLDKQSDSEKIAIIPDCREVKSIDAVGPRPIEIDAVPEAIALGGVCKMGELVVPIVARTK